MSIYPRDPKQYDFIARQYALHDYEGDALEATAYLFAYYAACNQVILEDWELTDIPF